MLTGLQVAPGTLVFSPSTSAYTVTLPARTVSVLVTASAPARVALRVGSTTVLSGQTFTIPLTGAVTDVQLTSTAESGATSLTRVSFRLRAFGQQSAVLQNTAPAFPDRFGDTVALSDDGSTLAVGDTRDRANTTGINGTPDGGASVHAGGVTVYVRANGLWLRQAFLKAMVPRLGDSFGGSLALSANGNTLVVGVENEDSNAVGVNGNPTSYVGTGSNSGAVYVFVRSGTTWTQQAYLKASNAGASDGFGRSLSLSSDGTTLAVGADGEASAAAGVNGNQASDTLPNAGATYVFRRTGTTWAQVAYLKASNPGSGDFFGGAVSLDGTGTTLAVGAWLEDSSSLGVNGNQADEFAVNSGAVYVFRESPVGVWSQQAYLKASNTGAMDLFGLAVSLSRDGQTLAVGARGDDSSATGINGSQSDGTATDSGAVFVFRRSGTTWVQDAFLKSSFPNATSFGDQVALTGDAQLLLVGVPFDRWGGAGLDAVPSGVLSSSGAVYVFAFVAGAWTQLQYLKAPAPAEFGAFGKSLAVTADGGTMAIGGPQLMFSGAACVYGP